MIQILLIIFWVAWAYFMLRINWVYDERRRVLTAVSNLAHKAVEGGDYDWKKFFDLFDEHSYEEMLFKFWIPVKSFYKDIQ